MIDHHTRLPPGVPIDDGERNSETRPQNRPRAVRRENMRTVQKTLLLAVVLSLFGAVTVSSVAEAGQQQRHLTMAIPDPKWLSPPLEEILVRFGAPRGTLTEPVAERVGCERTGPGTVVLPCTPAVYNASRAINGGMALLVYSRARGVSADIPISFVRVRFFRQGFFFGYKSCGYDGIARDAAKI